MKKVVALVVGMSLLAGSMLLRAETMAPDVLVKNTVQEVLLALKQEKSDKKKIQAMVDEKVLPMFDFTLMTKRAIGPGTAWKEASAEQKKMLVDEFRNLLVRAFIAKAFTSSGNRTVKFEPSKYVEGDDQVTIKTQIITQGEQPIAVDYDLKKTSAGWKAVDIAIEGPRLAAEIYHNQFHDPLQQSGVDGVIKFLVEKNKSADGVAISVRKAEAK